ncbi:MAG: maleylpyruvate isomerase family protein, partial [Actinobacteria bacterium]|nr:maleylpyruvate isomerase family protein [Actinomycetota bacterium]
MDVEDYIGFVVAEGELFATAADQGDLTVDIASCPGWDMRELVRHLGLIHLWAAGNVASPTDEWLAADDLTDLAGHWPELATAWPEDADLVAWYRDTHANLVDVLKSAPANLDCFTFLPAPSPLIMWSRRQASEIAIHRFDA